jgi:hypothetical protein
MLSYSGLGEAAAPKAKITDFKMQNFEDICTRTAADESSRHENHQSLTCSHDLDAQKGPRATQS